MTNQNKCTNLFLLVLLKNFVGQLHSKYSYIGHPTTMWHGGEASTLNIADSVFCYIEILF